MTTPQQIDRFRHVFIADLPEDLWKQQDKAVQAYLDITIYGEGTVGERVVIEDWGCAFDGHWIQQPAWIPEEVREREKRKALKNR